MLVFFDPTTLRVTQTIDDPAPPEAVAAARRGDSGLFLRTVKNYPHSDALKVELTDGGLAVTYDGVIVPAAREMSLVFNDDGSIVRGLPPGSVLRYNGTEYPVPSGEDLEVKIDTPGEHRFDFVAPGYMNYTHLRVIK